MVFQPLSTRSIKPNLCYQIERKSSIFILGTGTFSNKVKIIYCLSAFKETSFGPGKQQQLPPNFQLCLLLWFEFFRTIALLLGALTDLIAGYSKLSSASVECRREIFGRTNFHLRVVSLAINVSSTLGDDERRTGEGTEQCRLTDRTPRLLDF